jgi:hypothetical protein
LFRALGKRARERASSFLKAALCPRSITRQSCSSRGPRGEGFEVNRGRRSGDDQRVADEILEFRAGSTGCTG